MKLRTIRLKAKHPYTYRPEGEEKATAGRLFWNEQSLDSFASVGLCVEIIYDNGFINHHPLDDLFIAYERIE